MAMDLGPLKIFPPKPPSPKISKRGYYWLRSTILAPKIFKKGLLLSSIRKDLFISVDIYGDGLKSTRKNSPEAPLPKIFKKGLLLA
jgi:hypothetical protein